MGRVDELAAPDVDADVTEPIEEHEVSRLELVTRDVDALVPERVGRVRQRDAHRRIGVDDEARAVERVRPSCAPGIGFAELRHGHAHHASVVRRRRDSCNRGRVARGRRRRLDGGTDNRRVDLRLLRLLLLDQPCARLGRQERLLSRLLGLEPLDLAPDRRQELPAVREPALDLRLRGRTVGDDALLRATGLLERGPVDGDLVLEQLYLAEHLGILVGDAARRLQAVDDVVQTL